MKETSFFSKWIFAAFITITAYSQDFAVSTATPVPVNEPPEIILREGFTAGTVSIPGLKAVLVAGAVDGDDGPTTLKNVRSLQNDALLLRANGVEVVEFYTPNTNWEDIKEAARGAHFLLYRGHGIYIPPSDFPKSVGGLCLKPRSVLTPKIREELSMAPGAIVMFGGACFTAGNAGYDIGKLDEEEAERRVGLYSRAFMELGFSGYYANWNAGANRSFLQSLFDGKTLGQAYEEFRDYHAASCVKTQHPLFPENEMWVDHDNRKGGPAYNHAFAGKPNETLLSLFGKKSQSTPAQPKPTSGPSTAVESAAPTMPYLTELEKQVVLEVNRMRRNPKAYALYVKELMKLYNGNMIEYPDVSVYTNEGIDAAKECYDFLLRATPLDTMIASEGMSRAAEDHVLDQGKTRQTGHSGRDGSSPFDRMERYGQWERTAGENIDYGHDDARGIVLSLIIDDGVPSRGHRNNLFNPDYKKIGVACGPHKEYRNMCVMDLAGGYKEK